MQSVNTAVSESIQFYNLHYQLTLLASQNSLAPRLLPNAVLCVNYKQGIASDEQKLVSAISNIENNITVRNQWHGRVLFAYSLSL